MPPPPAGYPAPTYSANEQPPGQDKPSNALAITALVFAIVSALLFWVPFLGVLLALVGLILGAIAWSKANKTGQPKGMAVAATIISALVFLVGAAWTVIVVWIGVEFGDDINDCTQASLTQQEQQDCLDRLAERLGTRAQ